MKNGMNVLALVVALTIGTFAKADGWECYQGEDWTVLLYDRVATPDHRVPAHLNVYQKGVRSLSVDNPRSTVTDEIEFEGNVAGKRPDNWPQGWTKPGSQYYVDGRYVVVNEGRGELTSITLQINGNPFSTEDKLVEVQRRKGKLLLEYSTKTTPVDLECYRYKTSAHKADAND